MRQTLLGVVGGEGLSLCSVALFAAHGLRLAPSITSTSNGECLNGLRPFCPLGFCNAAVLVERSTLLRTAPLNTAPRIPNLVVILGQ